MFLKLATNEQSDKAFLLKSKVCPQGVVCPCPGAIYMYEIIKKWFKIRLQRDFFETLANDWSDKTSKFCPFEVVCPWTMAIYIY